MRKRSLKMNAALNMIRRGSAILFPFVTFSYASHKLGAEGIGMFSFCQSIISYFLLLAALGVSTYAVREGQAYRSNREELRKFISEVYTINVILTVLSYVVLGILLFFQRSSGYSQIIFILSISIILTTVGADWINTLLEDYLFITVRYILVQVSCFAMLIVFVRGPEDLHKYAIIGMLSSAGGNLLNIVHIRMKIHFHLTRKPNIRNHIIPMITLFSNNLAIKVYLLSDVTILGILMADQYVGYYSAASKVYTAVKELVNAMILVTVPRFSLYLVNDDHSSYEKSYYKVVSGTATIIAPCVVCLFFQAENILYFLGGKEYVYGTRALQILSFAMIFAVGACLFSQSILIPNKQERYFLKVTIISAVANILFNFALIPFIGVDAAAITTLLSEGIVCFMALYRGRVFISEILKITRDIRSALLGCIGIALVCMGTNLLFQNRLRNLLVGVTISFIVYLTIIYAMKNSVIYNAIYKIKSNLKKYGGKS